MSRFESAISDLVAQEWAVLPDFLAPPAVAELLEEARARFEADQFRRAAVGAGAGLAVREEIRSDRILWIDPEALTPAQARYWAEVDALREALNRELFLGLVSLEAHFAVYAPGAFYQRHVDRHTGSDARVISSCFYLNPDWRAEDGGHLRLHLEGEALDIAPAAGTLVIFRSDTVLHEVLPASRTRYSVTGWFRRRSLEHPWG